MKVKKDILWAVATAIMVTMLFTLGSADADQASPEEEVALFNSPWTSNGTPISIAGQKSSVPSLALGTDGVLHTAFKQGSTISSTANEPYYSMSSDGGNNWSTPQIIRDDPFSFVVDKVDIAVATNGVVHAVWVEKNNSTENFTLYYASKSGDNWGPAETIEVAESPSVLDQPSLAVNSGRVYVVWANTSRIRFAARSGGTWSTPAEIGRSELPEITIDASGNLHVVFLESRDTLVARYTQSLDNGVTWSNDVGLSAGNKDVKDIDLAVQGSTVHVVFGASEVIGGAIDPISSTPTIAPYYTSCSVNCDRSASWPREVTATSVQAGNAPADAILLVPSISITEQNEAMIFYHGVLQENVNFEQVLGMCYQPDQNVAKNYKLPTSFTERMVKPQIVYADGVMHMVYERVKGQSVSTNFQEVHYAQLDVSCYNSHMPVISH